MFRDVLSITQTGTLRFCLPAFSRRIFFAAGLLTAFEEDDDDDFFSSIAVGTFPPSVPVIILTSLKSKRSVSATNVLGFLHSLSFFAESGFKIALISSSYDFLGGC